MAYANPGALFVGSMYREDRAFYRSLIGAARKAGYIRFVEPCGGALLGSILAADAGFTEIEASDVTIFSGILGRYVQGRSIEDMQITVRETGEVLTDPVDAMFRIKRIMLEAEAGSEYGFAVLDDFLAREEAVRQTLREQMDEVKRRVGRVLYRDLDMYDHLSEVLGDEKAVAVVNMPTYRGGYEASYKAVDTALSWREPNYNIFDPNGGYEAFRDFVANSKCLVLSYQEAESGKCVGEPVYGRQSGRIGVNSYIVANRPDEVQALLGKSCAVKDAGKMRPLKNPLLPSDYQIGRKSKVAVIKAKPENIRYYRRLLTRNFSPSQLSSGYVMLVDGYVAGVFGYITMSNALDNASDSVFIGFAIGVNSGFRVSKLLHTVACQRRVVAMELDDVQMTSIKRVKTAMISRNPSCSELRGVMKLERREKDLAMGYKLVYAADLQDKTFRQIVSEFVDKEERCRNK